MLLHCLHQCFSLPIKHTTHGKGNKAPISNTTECFDNLPIPWMLGYLISLMILSLTLCCLSFLINRDSSVSLLPLSAHGKGKIKHQHPTQHNAMTLYQSPECLGIRYHYSYCISLPVVSIFLSLTRYLFSSVCRCFINVNHSLVSSILCVSFCGIIIG